MNKLEQYKDKISTLNNEIDKIKTKLIKLQSQRETYLKNLKEDYNINENEIDKKLTELEEKYKNTLNSLEENTLKTEKILKKLNEILHEVEN